MATLTINNSICNISYATVTYGLLYNWWAAIGDTDGDHVANTSIANSGWSLPSKTDFVDLVEHYESPFNFAGNTAGKYLKETGTTYWLSPNTGALNQDNFNGRGAGLRNDAGPFANFKDFCTFWNIEQSPFNAAQANISRLIHDSEKFETSGRTAGGGNVASDKNYGFSVRLIKDSPTAAELALADGEYADPYIGNDGTVYLTVKIGTQVWLAQNLVETKYRDSTVIPEETDNTNWSNLTTGALCAYNNDWTNAGISKPAYY